MSRAIFDSSLGGTSSPKYLRVSLAAAITLGLTTGTFYRNARLGCINLLLTYPDGCLANCAFCGLARNKYIDGYEARFEKFIRVSWQIWPLELLIERITIAPSWVKRGCISMITHPKAKTDIISISRQVTTATNLPLSLLITPTLLKNDDLLIMKEAGADRIGIAIDTATSKLFDTLRGIGVHGPHRWDHYWYIYEQALKIFGQEKVGIHLIYGLGENERELISTIDYARAMGGSTHLFCFFPERFSKLSERPQPSVSGYRRMQLARWLIDNKQSRAADMAFDQDGRLIDFGISRECLEKAVSSGKPFMTSGCPGENEEVACNRPYGNEKPGVDLRNYPFVLEADDLALVREQLFKNNILQPH